MSETQRPIAVAQGAIEHPERLAVTDQFGRSITYGELDEAVNRTINALYDVGLEPGDVICLLLDNRAETVQLHQVAYRGGFRFTPMNPRLKGGELEYLLADSGAKVLFSDVSHLDLAKELTARAGTQLVAVGSQADSDDLGTLEALMERGNPATVPHRFGSVMSYTSGTTGTPKAVIRERSAPSPEVLDVLLRFGERLGFDPVHDQHLTTAPLYHGGPLVSAMHVMNLLGSVYLLRRFDPEDVLEVVEREAITSMYMVPTMYHRLLRLPESVRSAADVSSVQSIMHTGAPCPPDLKRRMIEWFGPVIYECYAATEGLGTYTVCTSEQWLKHPGTVGKPEHDVITIRDEQGNALAPGEVGLVYAQTLPGVEPFRYRGDQKKTREAYSEEGDYTLGDMGYLDEDGFLYLTGRATDMVITGGVNVYPSEVEQVFLTHGSISDVAVFGIPDEEWGERVVAAVQVPPDLLDSPTLADELIAYCRDQIATYKCPREVYLVEDLGRDPSGKLRKRLLRDQILAAGEPEA